MPGVTSDVSGGVSVIVCLDLDIVFLMYSFMSAANSNVIESKNPANP